MRKLILRRLHGDQSGVTLVIVALCLIAMMGMIVLVVDVGGLLWNRRAMVNASDAAALSAAKSCILPPSMDPQTAGEPYTRITHEIKEGPNGVCSLTLTHELDGAPVLASIVSGTFEEQGGQIIHSTSPWFFLPHLLFPAALLLLGSAAFALLRPAAEVRA